MENTWQLRVRKTDRQRLPLRVLGRPSRGLDGARKWPRNLGLRTHQPGEDARLQEDSRNTGNVQRAAIPLRLQKGPPWWTATEKRCDAPFEQPRAPDCNRPPLLPQDLRVRRDA